MNRNKIYPVVVFCVLTSVFLSISGCGSGSGQKERIVATVNGEPLSVRDFNRSLAMNMKRDPMFRVTPKTMEDQIDIMIDKRLLVQEAVKRKLDQTDRFVATIKSFWEQTLIRDLMDEKYREMNDISVTDSEIKAYYQGISHQKVFAFLETEDKKMVEKLLAMDPAGIKWKETVGPVSYEDTNSDLIRKAFTVPAGRMRVFKDGATYYLFYVKEDIALQIPPLDSVKEEIKVKLVDMKKEQFFKNWLKDMRSKADIKLNNEILKGIEFKNEQ